jgi:hypothetical protein
MRQDLSCSSATFSSVRTPDTRHGRNAGYSFCFLVLVMMVNLPVDFSGHGSTER